METVLQTLLNGLPIQIQHVGSTSIPGLIAKPVLDVDIIIEKEELMQQIRPILERSGYEFKGEQGIAGRYAFRQNNDYTPVTTLMRKWQTHHLYVCLADCLALKNHLLFRDALLNDEQLVKTYLQVKRSLAEEPGMTREEYNKRKTAFIITVLTKAGLTETELEEIIAANA